MYRRGPEFPIPLLNRNEILEAVDAMLSDSSGQTPQVRLSSLEWLAGEIETRILALRDQQHG